MSFSKKLLSGVLAMGIFSGISSIRALDQVYFVELNEFQKVIMPPGSRNIELARLPAFYKYLQDIFFLTVDNVKTGDDIDGLCALRSYIKFTIAQMEERGMGEVIRNGYYVFIKLISSIGNFANVIISENCGKHEISFKYLNILLDIYTKINRSTVLLSGLKKLKLYEIYSHMKMYIFARCMDYDESFPATVANNYGALFLAAKFYPLPENISFESYRNFADRIARYYASVANTKSAERMDRRNAKKRKVASDPVFNFDDSALPSFDQSCFSCKQAEKWSVTTLEYTLPAVTVEDDTDGSYSRMLMGKNPDENIPLFPDLEKSESYDENFYWDDFESKSVSAPTEPNVSELKQAPMEDGK